MPTWLTVGKLIAGNLDTIINVSKPLLTRKGPDTSALVRQQIEELQAASLLHGEQIAEIAADLKELVTLLDRAEAEAAAERLRARVVSTFAIGVAVVALLLSVVAIFLHR